MTTVEGMRRDCGASRKTIVKYGLDVCVCVHTCTQPSTLHFHIVFVLRYFFGLDHLRLAFLRSRAVEVRILAVNGGSVHQPQRSQEAGPGPGECPVCGCCDGSHV